MSATRRSLLAFAATALGTPLSAAAQPARTGALADLHAHFLTGDPSWYVPTIEPSLRGASEVRRVFLPLVLARSG